MRVLVTGASGFVGSAVCRELLARGHSVRAIVRRAGAPQVPPEAQQILVGDLASDFDLGVLLEGVDVVVHLAAIAHRNAREADIRRVNVDATIRLAKAALGVARRFVFMSSVKVHGEDSCGGSYLETSPMHPQDAYGQAKVEAERCLGELAAHGRIELALVRPPLVYGPGVKANFLSMLRWVDSGLPLPFASVRNRRSLIYVGNLADATVRCVEHSAASGPFLVGDEEIVSTPDLLSRTARALGRPPRLFHFPLGALRLAGALAGRSDAILRLTGNLVSDTSRAKRVLGWRPRYSLEEGLAATARWLRTESP
jgi:nucleoside-diphosphate-sugar epimerase